MSRCYARLRVLGTVAVVLLLVLAIATFRADYYLFSASTSLLYREIILDDLQSRILDHFIFRVYGLKHTFLIVPELIKTILCPF